MITIEAERCMRCGDCIDDEALALGWPIPVTLRGGNSMRDVEYVGPCCLDAYCSEGHVLPGDSDSSECPHHECATERAHAASDHAPYYQYAHLK